MIVSKRFELDLNNKQSTLMLRHAGVARHAWNWALSECKKALDARQTERNATGIAVTEIPSATSLHKKLVAEVKPLNPWYYAASSTSPHEAIRDLETAIKRVVRVKGTGFPKFKKKYGKQAFSLCGHRFKTDNNRIKLPIIGWVRVRGKIDQSHVITQVRIVWKSSKWFLSFNYEKEAVSSNGKTGVIGVDLGIKTLMTTSEGELISQPKQKHLLRRISLLTRKLSRQTPNSKGRRRTKEKLTKTYYKLACIRNDLIHKSTSKLIKNHGSIVIEDLNVSGMLKNHRLAKHIANASFYEIRRQFGYKARLHGAVIVVIDRFFPSSKTCSNCGNVQDMPLRIREFRCEKCGYIVDRDINAAKNIKAAGLAVVAQGTVTG